MPQTLSTPAPPRPAITESQLTNLDRKLSGQVVFSETMRRLYATDASAYREMPLAVAFPKTEDDIYNLIMFARQNKVTLIPRTAGTSLAGQVVGAGIVVDVSHHFTNIIEVNEQQNWVRLQPAVVRDELNRHLLNYGLFFGPETSTANRAMVGGMVGNNSCGANSVVYGSTREHLLEAHGFMSDGSKVVFKSLNQQAFKEKCVGDSLEAQVYQHIDKLLTDTQNQQQIREHFPKPSVTRRNTGYAIDLLLESAPFAESKPDFNFCKLIAGSEGTLFFLTEIKLHVDPLPPAHKALVCIHCHTVDESLRANLTVLQHNPSASELMDHYVLECTKRNIEQNQNRFFVNGDPAAILVAELSKHTHEEAVAAAEALVHQLKAENLGYDYPIITGDDIKKVWTLRKAGLGLLSNIPGDAKPVALIEDTAVDVHDLPAYIQDIDQMLEEKHGLHCVRYAHAGSGELHLRPIINLKTAEGHQLFKNVLADTAAIVKKYRGSLSGEHGDGRLRGEFLAFMIGEHNYKLIESVKKAWDPNNVFNANKIVDTPSMNTNLRYVENQSTPQFDTLLDFSSTEGYIRMAEMCNGSGDCRKSHLTGGTMCPSYMATRNEKDTTRARANILREMLTRADADISNPFNSEEIKEVMDLCLSCKGCKSECPSNVDVAKLKAEFTQRYYDANGVPLRTRLIAEFTTLSRLSKPASGLFNGFFKNKITGNLAKKIVGFHPDRSMPKLYGTTLRQWFNKNKPKQFGVQPIAGWQGKVWLFCDEFTNYNDVEIGQTVVKLLTRLGYEVELPNHLESGRTYLSKGLLRKAQSIARQNVETLSKIVTRKQPIIGIEPSALLTLRDEYIDLCKGVNQPEAHALAQNSLLIDEFLAREIDRKNIKKEWFSTEAKTIKVHGHCHQKALGSMVHTKKMLSLPANYEVHQIASGCCGMAGSFGYETEHYDVSMQIGELVLFPAVRKQPQEVIIAAAGTSCRHQIKDGTKRKALHPAEILFQALGQ